MINFSDTPLPWSCGITLLARGSPLHWRQARESPTIARLLEDSAILSGKQEEVPTFLLQFLSVAERHLQFLWARTPLPTSQPVFPAHPFWKNWQIQRPRPTLSTHHSFVQEEKTSKARKSVFSMLAPLLPVSETPLQAPIFDQFYQFWSSCNKFCFMHWLITKPLNG